MQQQQQQQIFKEKSVQEEIQVAYERFIHSVPRRPSSSPFQWRPPAHRCGASCDFFQYRNVNICKATLNWHYCTEETCDRMIRTSERQVCPLSGMAYDLELDTGGDVLHYQRASGGGGADDDATAAPANAHCDDYGDDTDAVRNETEELSRAPTPPRVHFSLHDDDATLISKERTMEQALAPKHAATDTDAERLQWEPEESTQQMDADMDDTEASFDEGEHHARIALFESMLTHIFAEHVNTHKGLFRTIALNAERTWLLIQGSDTIARKKRRYQPEYHLLAIVYNMCHGYRCLQNQVVPFSQWVKQNIPQVRDLKRLSLSTGEIKVKNFTQASKLFRVCMIELLQRNSGGDLLQRLVWTT